jgi:3-deoxy-manno-octulosonate cytidylyltransferase (CMP-KDO synthetase)
VTDKSAWLVVVPARYASTRLPAKPLAELGGKPMVVRVFENLRPLQQQGAKVVVATDHRDIVAACERHGVPVEMTSEAHQSGTDRCQEVAARFHHSFILNVQGDEPFVDCNSLLELMTQFSADAESGIGTMVYRNRHADDYALASVVKAVRAADGRCLYFSRSPVPHMDMDTVKRDGFWHHVGVYAFRRNSLSKICSLPVSPLEKLEKLEQLRALEHGIKIMSVETQHFARGIDTPADLELARARFV